MPGIRRNFCAAVNKWSCGWTSCNPISTRTRLPYLDTRELFEREACFMTHGESIVNQLVNLRFCKKQQVSWTLIGPLALLHVKAALINGTLGQYTDWQQAVHQAA
jgi:hypothetical protein